MKIWIPKGRKHLLTIYPEYTKKIIKSKLDEHLLYIDLLLTDFEKIENLEYFHNEHIEIKLRLISIIMTILFTRGINIILNKISNVKFQRLISLIIIRIKDLKEGVNECKKIEDNIKIDVINKLNNVHKLIKNKLLSGFNIIEDVKDIILEYY